MIVGGASGARLLGSAQWAYLVGLVALEAYSSFGHAAVFGAKRGRVEFLVPLLLVLTSVLCAPGLCTCSRCRWWRTWVWT